MQAGREAVGRSVLIVAECPSEEVVKVRRQGIDDLASTARMPERAIVLSVVTGAGLHGIAGVLVQAEEW